MGGKQSSPACLPEETPKIPVDTNNNDTAAGGKISSPAYLPEETPKIPVDINNNDTAAIGIKSSPACLPEETTKIPVARTNDTKTNPEITNDEKNSEEDDDPFQLLSEEASQKSAGFFRGVAAAARAKLPALKAASKQVIRAAGSNRPLAFASEGAVAGSKVLPSPIYYGAWGISGVAVVSDITLRTWNAPEDKKHETALYYSAFHLPASLIVPAYLIHQVVHFAEHSMNNHAYARRLPQRVKPFVPVSAALLAIIPIVPIVDHAAEAIMEPTLGKYLGLEFDHDKHSHEEESKKKD